MIAPYSVRRQKNAFRPSPANIISVSMFQRAISDYAIAGRSPLLHRSTTRHFSRQKIYLGWRCWVVLGVGFTPWAMIVLLCILTHMIPPGHTIILTAGAWTDSF